MIVLEGIAKTFTGEREVLAGIDLKVQKGEWVWLLGVTGIGKSVLTRIIYGDIPPDEGKITVLGEEVTSLNEKNLACLRRRIGIVFQDLKLFEDRTTLENIWLVLWALGLSKSESRERAENTLEKVGMQEFLAHCPYELSVGQRQKVALARALAKEPELLILDEPFSALDETQERAMLKLLGEINHKGTTIFAVSHEHEVLHFLPGRILQLTQEGVK